MATRYKWEDRRGIMFDSEEFEHVRPLNPIYFYDDFLATWTVVPAAGSPESGCEWVGKTVQTVGAPAVALTADGAMGVAQCALDNTGEKQEAALYHDDNRQWLITQGVVFEARVKVSVLPTGNAEAVWGLVGDWHTDGPDSIVYSAFFTADGSGEIFCESDDNTAGEKSVTSGVTVTNAQWKVYRIDCRDVTGIKFYINGARVAAATTFAYTATGANATLQPFLDVFKASGTGVGTIDIDYVRIWGNRS